MIYYGSQKDWKAVIFKNFYSKVQLQYTYYAVLVDSIWIYKMYSSY